MSVPARPPLPAARHPAGSAGGGDRLGVVAGADGVAPMLEHPFETGHADHEDAAAPATPGPGAAQVWRVACAGCGRRGYRLLERHPHGWLVASARRCPCGSTRFAPLAPRTPRGRRAGGPAPGVGAQNRPAGGAGPTAAPTALEPLRFAEHLTGARTWAGNALASTTRAAYARAWRRFCAWCATHQQVALPAQVATVAAYLDANTRPRRYQTSTIQLRLAAISHVHRLGGVADPTADPQLRLVWKGIRRDRAAPAVTPAKAATGPIVSQVLAGITARSQAQHVDPGAGPGAAPPGAAAAAVAEGAAPDEPTGEPAGAAPPDEPPLDDVRDRALLALALLSGRRSAELVGLNREDVSETDEGLQVRFRFSKTNQEGKPNLVGLPYQADPAACPVRAWRAWTARLDRAQRARGETPAPSDPAFRPVDRWGHLGAGRLTTRGVRDLLARRFAAAGLPAGFSTHSLRRGFATAARQGGADLVAIMGHGGWKSAQTVTGYIEEADLFRDNPAAKIRLEPGAAHPRSSTPRLGSA
jgi:site-specific recombinase XerD